MFRFNDIRNFILTLPETKEIDHFGKPSFRINNKIFATIQPDGNTLTVKTVGEDREIYTTMDPETYRVPDTFSNLNYMNINLNTVSPKELKGLIIKAWSSVAPKRSVKAFDVSKFEDDRGIT
ncbi:MmcQ/YjbR family DNA-binding protein [Paenibacillus sp. LHD-117]|uniref:MmcQ/YjbR family DNA-binding protein n=1 Tax=Paenibacillus sp. LHD-117 TaxID=3071412 RepID=UPI0027DF5396|nr:MmcQ/YjbR family DNA-binding protein [Paenibacillus sp. LHD-117]MDQ6418011.1 MmcQ/YjbR family DNA-binding protein [Paenibacillus sp. LHD-117]